MNNGEDYRMVQVPVDQLQLDPENPRLPSQTKDWRSELSIIEWMVRNENIIELMGSIGTQGYFPGEPLLVVRDLENTTGYYVVEGNRRLAAAKLLLHPELATTKFRAIQLAAEEAEKRPTELPVILFPNRERIYSYLGYRHVTGIKAWSPIQKARYLRLLERTLPTQGGTRVRLRELAKAIGSRSDFVGRLLTGLAVWDRASGAQSQGIEALDDEKPSFSLLTTALSYSSLAEFIGLTDASDPQLAGIQDERLAELMSWLFREDAQGTTRVGESRHLKELSRVVIHPQALDAFRKGLSLTEADQLTTTPAQVFQDAVGAAHDSLVKAAKYLPVDPQLDEQAAQTLCEQLGDIEKQAKRLCQIVAFYITSGSEPPH